MATRNGDADILAQLSSLSTKIYNNYDPHNPHIYLDRGKIYVQLGFHDLAAADAYRALMLLECVWEPEEAEYVARRRIPDEGRAKAEEDDEFVDITRLEYNCMIGTTYLLLVDSLVHCGCLRDANEFRVRGIQHLTELIEENNTKEDPKSANGLFNETITQLQTLGEILIPSQKVLPAQGYARRVLYPWNEHEPDRKSPETLALLNKRLETIAPNLEVRAVVLPALHESATQDSGSGGNDGEEVSIQLGLFAKNDLQPGDIILRESSLLTATNRLHDDLCDACNGPLPDLSSGNGVACDECIDTIFCSQTCHDQAQSTYHAAICGQEGLESIGKDVADPSDKADYLYFLLLARAIAMAATQDVHPLDLPEIKYIWGDFHPYHPGNSHDNDDDDKNDSTDSDGGDGKLPFSFQLSILQPIRLLEEMGLDPFTSLNRYDTWVLNTLYAKFRGTASGRLSTWDGGPEVCAVHPLWCLANHSCDPNVRWEWGGEFCFMVRRDDERAVWKRRENTKERSSDGVIRENEEILNHYCDIGLDVVQRRDWARGALGGLCQCERCQWEEAS